MQSISFVTMPIKLQFNSYDRNGMHWNYSVSKYRRLFLFCRLTMYAMVSISLYAYVRLACDAKYVVGSILSDERQREKGVLRVRWKRMKWTSRTFKCSTFQLKIDDKHTTCICSRFQYSPATHTFNGIVVVIFTWGTESAPHQITEANEDEFIQEYYINEL